MPITILAAIAGQFAAGAFNTWRQGKNMREIQTLQREFEETLQTKGIEQAWEKIHRLNVLQKQMDEESHRYRLKRLDDGFINVLERYARNAVLANWPLHTLPIVMKGESLFPEENLMNATNGAQAKISLHCLLAPSNDAEFNKGPYREIEHQLCRYINQYWNAASSHPVLFYSEAWKSHTNPVIADNLKTEIGTLPTLLIIPQIMENGGIKFLIQLWGIPELKGLSEAEYIPTEMKYPYKQKQKYTQDDQQQILDELCPTLEAFIGYVADQYYWAYDKIPPLLPSLLANGMNPVQKSILLEEYRVNYLEMFDKYVIEDNEINRMSMLVAPEKSLELYKKTDFFLDLPIREESLKKIWTYACLSKGIGDIENIKDESVFFEHDTAFLKILAQCYAQIGNYQKSTFLNLLSEKAENNKYTFELRRHPVSQVSEYKHINIEELDLTDILLKAKEFANNHQLHDFYLLVYKRGESRIEIHIIDDKSNIVIYREPFDFLFEYLTLKKRKKIQTLFGTKRYFTVKLKNIQGLIKKIEDGQENVFHY